MMVRRWTVGVSGLAVCAAIAAACSGESGSGGDDGTGGSTASNGSGGLNFGVGGSGGSSSGAGGGFSSSGASPGSGGEPNACAAEADESGCVGERYEGEASPLDIYVMFDSSCSMSCPAELTGQGLCCRGGPDPRIDHVRDAIEQFMDDPLSAGIGVGVGYFGDQEAGQTSCDPSDYSAPSVPMGLLPANAARVARSLRNAEPTGETPTGAAIRGACTYAAQWKDLHPGHAVVVLLVTDGVPEAPVTSQNGGCSPSVPDAVQAAGACAGHDPSLPVYVLGVGRQLSNLNQIAAAGGTGQAYLVEGGDVSAEVLRALNAIRADAAIPCQLKIPPPPSGESLDLAAINVGHCNSQGESQTFYYVQTPSGCDGQTGGWYYDDPAAPANVLLCEASCERVIVPGGSLFMSVGCTRRDIIR